MEKSTVDKGPVVRLFEVKAKPGCKDQLIQKFATTSAEVVEGAPGNLGYFFGRGVAGEDDLVVFASVWEDLDAVKDRFGADWLASYLPPGYEQLIDECSVRHIDFTHGWHVKSP